jgi:hypothetical protein
MISVFENTIPTVNLALNVKTTEEIVIFEQFFHVILTNALKIIITSPLSGKP